MAEPTDPFAQLAAILPAMDVEPDGVFVDSLRTRLASRLNRSVQNPDFTVADHLATRTTTTPTTTTPTTTISQQETNMSVPPLPSVSPYLIVSDAREAIAFYVDVLGAVPIGDIYVGDDSRVGHAELQFGSTTLMLADEYPEMGFVGPLSLGGTPVTLHYEVPDAAVTVGRAKVAGATIEREVTEQVHGSLQGAIRDPWGHRWIVSTPLPEMPSTDEINDRADGFTVTAAVGSPVVPSQARRRNGELAYVTLPVPDLGDSVHFYERLFGWETSDPGSEGGVHLLNTNFPGSLGPQALSVCFIADDLDASVELVREMGGTASDPVGPAAWRTSTCHGPASEPFTLVQAAPGPYPAGNDLHPPSV